MAFHNAIKYRGYTLDCEPVRWNDTCFIAQVTISREAGEDLDEFSFPNLCIRETAPSAAQFAKAWGGSGSMRIGRRIIERSDGCIGAIN